MKKRILCIIGICAAPIFAEIITLSAPTPFTETDLSRPLALPARIATFDYFRAAVITLPQNAQVVVSFGNDLNRDGTLDAEEIETTLDSDESLSFRLPNGTLPAWDTFRVTQRGGDTPASLRIGITAPALKIMVY